MFVVRSLTGTLSAMLLLVAATAHAAAIERQRAEFLEAEAAIERGATDQYRQLHQRLRDYPLLPYLEYQALLKRLDAAGNTEVRKFIKTYADTPLADRLKNRWLNLLAKKKRWKSYLAFYRPTKNVTLRCHHLNAMIHTGQRKKALSQVAEIWLHGKSLPRACDPVFAAWAKAGYRTKSLSWQRIEKAMEAGEWRLAEYLGKSLSNTDRVWLKRWVRLYRNPRHLSEIDRYRDAHPYREVMLSHSVRRLARWDGEEALQQWKVLRKQFRFSPAQVRRTEHYIARNLVRASGDEAYRFVRSLKINADDGLAIQRARIRAALFREDWPQVAQWIEALPEAERNEEKWRYWLARALAEKGQLTTSDILFADLAAERSYYGFLAADRLGMPYHLAHTETPVSPATLKQVENLDAIKRARELFALERWIDGRREWRVATLKMPAKQLKAAAKLAEQQGWHDRAIFTLARTGYWDDLKLRFPLQHAALVNENARLHGIDRAWVFAIMRQESAFMNNAHSHAGAMGLMQLMPATARSVARKMLKRKPPRRQELFEPDTNIALGSAYLKQMMDELGKSPVLATAAYNAGPHRVTRWLPDRALPADIWIELVPFKETRGYLRRVLSYTVIYEKRMGETPTRLSDRLQPVPPKISLLGDVIAVGAVDP